MRNQVIANVGVNFKFYRRSRMLFVAGSLILLVTALSTLPSLFALTDAQHLDLITTIVGQLSGFALMLGVGLVLLNITHHLDNRSIKLVVTKPCPPEVWLLSNSISALVVTSVFMVVILLVCSLLFVVWNIPYQMGLVFVLLNDFARTLVWVSYATVFAVLVRPVVAVLLMMVLQEEMFYYLKLLLATALKSTENSVVMAAKTGKILVDGVYMLLPMTSPFAKESEQVYKSLRGDDAPWLTLISTWGYAMGVWLFCFLLASYFLSKKRLV